MSQMPTIRYKPPLIFDRGLHSASRQAVPARLYGPSAFIQAGLT